jgi:hypothetical protein
MPEKTEAKLRRLILSKSHGPKREGSLSAEIKAADLHLHEILNQLSLINLGCFKLRNLLEGKSHPLKELDTIETAVSEGAELLEKLNRSIQNIESRSSQKKSPAAPRLSTGVSNVYDISPHPKPRR